VAVIDGVFCLHGRMCDIQTWETLSMVMREWSEIMGTYNTPDTSVRDRRSVNIGYERNRD